LRVCAEKGRRIATRRPFSAQVLSIVLLVLRILLILGILLVLLRGVVGVSVVLIVLIVVLVILAVLIVLHIFSPLQFKHCKYSMANGAAKYTAHSTCQSQKNMVK